MKTERAIELLNRISDSQFDGIHGDERREALDMAVRVLSGDVDTISRKMAIDAVNSETVSTNPEHFKSSEKFIKFMDDVDIASFGKWQWANGYNTALVATRVQLKKLPSAQPDLDEWCTDCKEYDDKRHCCPRWNRVIRQALKDAQPERKKGKWISEVKGKKAIIDEYGNVTCSAHCSECGDWLTGSDEYACRGRFCPNCGARMDGESE